MINMIKFVCFSFILMTFLGCKTSISDTSVYISGNSKDRYDYLLVFRGSDSNGAVNINFASYYIKKFFSTPSWPFFMNYNVIPSIDESPNQGYKEIIDNIQDISSKLYSNSTFIFFINTHGENGYCITGTKNVNATDVINALKEGLDKNHNTKTFKRLIIITDTCHSGEFVGQFQANENSRNGSLFKEGIYIYDSDASQIAYSNTTSEIFIPMFTFLRELQVRRYNNTTTNYQELYKSTLDDIVNIRMEGIDVIHSKRYSDSDNTIYKIKKLFGEDDRLYFSQPPKFYDLVNIIERINSQNTDMGKPSMNIEFSDEYQTSQKGSLRNKTIFPDI